MSYPFNMASLSNQGAWPYNSGLPNGPDLSNVSGSETSYGWTSGNRAYNVFIPSLLDDLGLIPGSDPQKEEF